MRFSPVFFLLFLFWWYTQKEWYFDDFYCKSSLASLFTLLSYRELWISIRWKLFKPKTDIPTKIVRFLNICPCNSFSSTFNEKKAEKTPIKTTHLLCAMVGCFPTADFFGNFSVVIVSFVLCYCIVRVCLNEWVVQPFRVIVFLFKCKYGKWYNEHQKLAKEPINRGRKTSCHSHFHQQQIFPLLFTTRSHIVYFSFSEKQLRCFLAFHPLLFVCVCV